MTTTRKRSAGEALERAQHIRLRDFMFFDDIRITADSRWKDGDMSGTEWRSGVLISYLFKGEVVATAGAMTMDVAPAIVGFHMLDKGAAGELTVNEKLHHKLSERCCDQVGCRKPWKFVAWLKARYTSSGDTINTDRAFYRRFCEDHKDRGDCDLEDCDDNYTVEKRR